MLIKNHHIFLPLQRTFRLLKNKISSFFPFFEDIFSRKFGLFVKKKLYPGSRSGSGSADPIKSRSNPDPAPKQTFNCILYNITHKFANDNNIRN